MHQFCKKKASSHGSGTYGFRNQERKRLGVKRGSTESEHAISYQAASRHNSFARKSKKGRGWENILPAYLEETRFHRANIGTGNRKTPDESGFNSRSYWDSQYTLLEQDDAATAIQLNQLTYAYQPGFKTSPLGTVSDQSFYNMVMTMKIPTPNAEHTGYDFREPTIDERLEMIVARLVTRTESDTYPTREQIEEIRSRIIQELELNNTPQ